MKNTPCYAIVKAGGERMKARLNMLWRVPVYCLCAGFAAFWLIVQLVAKFGVITLPDGSISSNPTVTTLLEILIFAATLAIGYLIFRKMTKKEIFWSSTIIVVILLILQIYQLIMSEIDIGAANTVGMWLVYATEWCRVIPILWYYINPSSWVGAFLTCLAPYIFIIFGRKEV